MSIKPKVHKSMGLDMVAHGCVLCTQAVGQGIKISWEVSVA